MGEFDIFWGILGFIVGFVAHIIWIWQLKKQALVVVRTQASTKGNAAKAEQEGELMGLIMDAAAAFKASKEAEEDIPAAAMKILPALAAKYPSVVAKHGKKLFKMVKDGGFEDLID